MNIRPVFLLFALVLLACDSKRQVASDIGLQFYSFRAEFNKDIEGTLKMISALGIKNIEGGETYGMEMPAFLDLLDRYNLSVVSIGAGYDELKNTPETAIERARQYGAKYIMCPWIPHQPDNFDLEHIQLATEVFNNAGKQIRTAGLQLVYHPHGYEFSPYGQGNLFDYMIANARYFDFEMDVYWFAHGGVDPMDYLNKYPGKFKLMHLKDMRKGVKGNYSGTEDVETNVVLGSGQINIAGLVQKARELGIEYLFIEDESSRVMAQVPKSLDFLSTLP